MPKTIKKPAPAEELIHAEEALIHTETYQAMIRLLKDERDKIAELKTRLDFQTDRLKAVETSLKWNDDRHESLQALYESTKYQRCCQSEGAMKILDSHTQLMEILKRPVYETQQMVDQMRTFLIEKQGFVPEKT